MKSPRPSQHQSQRTPRPARKTRTERIRNPYQAKNQAHRAALQSLDSVVSDQAQALAGILDQNRPSLAFSWKRFGYWFSGFVCFMVLSSASIGYAMGYRFNATRGTIEQTSVIRVGGALSGLAANAYLNGALVATALPVKLTTVFPGSYELRIEKPGYQIWQQSIRLVPNERYSFTDLVLLYTKPRLVGESLPGQVPNQPGFTNGLRVVDTNELWIEDMFITRSSEDIVNARWFTSTRSHIVYQKGATLYLYDVRNKVAQALFEAVNAEPVRYAIESDGRILLVQKSDQTFDRFELYEQNSLFNLLVAD
jgi:hypothetical protein